MLGYGKVYTADGIATGTDGKQVPIAGTFTTVAPETEVRNTVNPVDGAVVGVAAPVTVSFGVEPEDKALIQKNVTITTTPEVEGAWAWVQHDDGRWGWTYRPRTTGRPAPRSTSTPSCTACKFDAGSYGAAT